MNTHRGEFWVNNNNNNSHRRSADGGGGVGGHAGTEHYVEICFGDRRYRVAHSLSCGLRSDVLGWVGLAKGSAGTKYCTQLSNRYVLERLVFSTPTCHLSTIITGGIPHSNPDGLTYLIWGFAWQIVCCCVCWRITRLFRS